MDFLLLATKGDRGVVERKVPVVVVVVVVAAAVAANDREPEEPRDVVQYVVVAVTEGELEATALRVQVVVVAATEGEGVEETSLLLAHLSLQKRNRASSVKL